MKLRILTTDNKIMTNTKEKKNNNLIISAPAFDTLENKLIYPIKPENIEATSKYIIFSHIIESNIEYEKDRFKCVKCNETVTEVMGTLNRWHFKHAPGSQCTYTEEIELEDKNVGKKGGESNIHKLAKYELCNKLRQRAQISIIGSKCRTTDCPHRLNKINIIIDNTDDVKIEKTIDNEGHIADVVVFDRHGNIKYIFEVLHTNKTISRPSQWFEIRAEEILEKCNSNIILDKIDDNNKKGSIILEDVKDYYCGKCPQSGLEADIIVKEMVCNKQRLDLTQEELIGLFQKSLYNEEFNMCDFYLKNIINIDVKEKCEMFQFSLTNYKPLICDYLLEKVLTYNFNNKAITELIKSCIIQNNILFCEYLIRKGGKFNFNDDLTHRLYDFFLNENNTVMCNFLIRYGLKLKKKIEDLPRIYDGRPWKYKCIPDYKNPIHNFLRQKYSKNIKKNILLFIITDEHHQAYITEKDGKNFAEDQRICLICLGLASGRDLFLCQHHDMLKKDIQQEDVGIMNLCRNCITYIQERENDRRYYDRVFIFENKLHILETFWRYDE